MIKKCNNKNNQFSTNDLNEFGENTKFFELIRLKKDNNWACQAKQFIPIGTLIMEYRGSFHTYEEFHFSIDIFNLLLPHICVFSYKKNAKTVNKIIRGGGGDDKSLQYCVIDSRFFGNYSRFLRYSCLSNSRIKKVFIFIYFSLLFIFILVIFLFLFI